VSSSGWKEVGVWAGRNFGRNFFSKWTRGLGRAILRRTCRRRRRCRRGGLVEAALKRTGWSEADLKARRQGEPRKVELAWHLRSQTTMPLAWIAERLNLGPRGHLAWLLERHGQSRLTAPVDQRLLGI
jgi:hypothetical protein